MHTTFAQMSVEKTDDPISVLDRIMLEQVHMGSPFEETEFFGFRRC